MAEVTEAETKLPLLPSRPLPLLQTCLIVDLGVLRFFVGIGVTRAALGRLKVNLSLLEKRGGKSHFGMTLLVAFSGICKFCKARQSALPTSIQTKHAPRVSLLMAFRMVLHAML